MGVRERPGVGVLLVLHHLGDLCARELARSVLMTIGHDHEGEARPPGGVDRRESMTAPEYITGEWARREYLRGYSHVAEIAYGPDWRTCSFIRSAAFEVGGKVR